MGARGPGDGKLARRRRAREPAVAAERGGRSRSAGTRPWRPPGAGAGARPGSAFVAEDDGDLAARAAAAAAASRDAAAEAGRGRAAAVSRAYRAPPPSQPKISPEGRATEPGSSGHRHPQCRPAGREAAAPGDCGQLRASRRPAAHCASPPPSSLLPAAPPSSSGSWPGPGPPPHRALPPTPEQRSVSCYLLAEPRTSSRGLGCLLPIIPPLPRLERERTLTFLRCPHSGSPLSSFQYPGCQAFPGLSRRGAQSGLLCSGLRFQLPLFCFFGPLCFQASLPLCWRLPSSLPLNSA